MNQESSTRERILAAAEKHFGTSGFDGTSLRAITTEAGVNLAAVNYHFRSKEELLNAVIARRTEPIGRIRLELLDRYESEHDGRPPIEAVLDAFLRPVLETCATAPSFACLLGRMYAEPRMFFDRVYKPHILPHVARFRSAFAAGCPHLTAADLDWRIFLLAGGMAFTLAAADILPLISNGACNARDVEAALRTMIPFYSAAFSTPASGAGSLAACPRLLRTTPDA